MWEKINKVYIGLIIGVLLPILIYLIFIYPKMQHFSYFEGYYEKMILKALPLFLSRCIFPNALVFFFFTWKNQLSVAKGLLISTAVLTGVLIIINFIL